MKTIFLLFFVFFTIQISSQDCDDNIIVNFECNSAFTLPGSVQGVSNSFSGGINTSSNIGEYTDNGTEGFDALIIDYGTEIDLTTNNQLKIKLYSPSKSIQILAKLEGGTAQEIYSPFSVIGEWQEFIFDFSDSSGNGNTRIVLFFDVTVTTGSVSELYYFDDLEWTSQAALNLEQTNLPNVTVTVANKELNIKGLENINGNISLYNVLGVKVLSEDLFFKSNNSLNVNRFSSGIYFLNIETINGRFRKKIMLK